MARRRPESTGTRERIQNNQAGMKSASAPMWARRRSVSEVSIPAEGCRPYSVAASAWRKKTVAAWARVKSPVGSRRPVSV